MKNVQKLFLSAGVVVVAIQFLPVERTNPPVVGDLQASPEVKAVIRRACYDCHSNETVWPWYSHLAPVSWLVSDDVIEGRERLNFSEWSTWTPARQASTQREAADEVKAHKMPLWFYTPLHPDAVLTDADRALIVAWGYPPQAK
jgi:hypothetical protein